jgi:hypothetical protein
MLPSLDETLALAQNSAPYLSCPYASNVSPIER